ncbi:hypothetical protein HK105_207818 [Polyrhizophydium stewartii]|uniref:Non-homologous end-joining factor 1 n=1 Tax=Polyrhizophydium stewartii TaxID=2732419 RepID=A0ABR4MZM1_9FUNG|nr:Non-ous end-joining factor 1 [Polyrhizophydium stewartii]
MASSARPTPEDMALLAGSTWQPLDMACEAAPSSAATLERRTTPQLYVLSHFARDSYVVAFSDFRQVWLDKADEPAVVAKLRLYNRNVVATQIEKVLAYVRQFVQPTRDHQRPFTFEAEMPLEAHDGLHLKFDGELRHAGFHWEFNAQPLPAGGSSEIGSVLLDRLTVPLLGLVRVYQSQRDELMQMLLRKDRELKELDETLFAHGHRSRPRGEPFDQNAFLTGPHALNAIAGMHADSLPPRVLADETVRTDFRRVSLRLRPSVHFGDDRALPDVPTSPLALEEDDPEEAARRLAEETAMLREQRRKELEESQAREQEKRKKRRL